MKYFLLWEFILYIGFTIGDVWYMPWSHVTNQMKYLAIISCVVYVWIVQGFFHRNKSKENREFGYPLQFALLYSCCADYFMLFTEEVWIGILGFVCVQICYGYSKRFLEVGVVFELALILLLMIGNMSRFEVVVIMAFGYIVFSVWNLVRVEKGILFVGMVLLFIGDIFVGVNQVLPVVGPAMWLFYLPSQVCIVMASLY